MYNSHATNLTVTNHEQQIRVGMNCQIKVIYLKLLNYCFNLKWSFPFSCDNISFSLRDKMVFPKKVVILPAVHSLNGRENVEREND